jgi:hypothetical protein
MSSFDPSGAGSLCSLGYDDSNATVSVYECFGADVQSYTTTGAFLASVARPGESANDVDIAIAPAGFTLGGTAVPAGTILFINGETGAADVYGLNPAGGVLSTLVASYGASHVVGGGYHPQRGTIFLVQDQLGGPGVDNQIAEIDARTGAVLNTFDTDVHGGFIVSFGDVEVHAGTGNLFIASSRETEILELTPTGGFVALHALPAGVSSLSGIALDEANGEIWVSGTGGTVWRLAGLPVSEPHLLALYAVGCALLGRRRH